MAALFNNRELFYQSRLSTCVLLAKPCRILGGRIMQRRKITLGITVLVLFFCDSGLEPEHTVARYEDLEPMPFDGIDSRPFGIRHNITPPPYSELIPCLRHPHPYVLPREKTDTPEREPEGAKCEFPCS